MTQKLFYITFSCAYKNSFSFILGKNDNFSMLLLITIICRRNSRQRLTQNQILLLLLTFNITKYEYEQD